MLLEEGANIAKELYLSILVDRDTGWPTFIASTEGGMEIEEVAEKTPEKIIKEAIDPAVGFQGHNGRNVAFALGLQNMEPAVINPFVTDARQSLSPVHGETCRARRNQPVNHHQEKTLVALDGKVSFDDNGILNMKMCRKCGSQ